MPESGAPPQYGGIRGRSLAGFAPPADALAGRVVLVTGAHGGLGAAAAVGIAAAGATVVLLGRRVPKLNRVYDAIEQAGGAQPALYPLDLEGATPTDYAELAERLQAELGRLDGILHAAAAFAGLTPLALTEPEDWLGALHVNLSAPLLLTRACLPLLQQSGDAAVVFVADDPERVAHAYWGGYGVAKQGLLALVPMLAEELSNGPVRVSALMPGPMRTSLRGRAWFGEDPAASTPPEAFVPALVHLLSPAGAPDRGAVLRVA
jgi:NAD(P)-dependent dehydrogenase (short-subunit alcohol dehydrogenase family)